MSTQSVRPPAPPRPPSVAEIQALMPGLRLYNPSDEWQQLRVHGRTDLYIPPDLGDAIEPHPATGVPTKCNGILEVKGRFLRQKDSSGKTIEGQDAQAIVSYVVQNDKMGEMGVVYLPGRDSVEDDAFKAYGREVYLRFREAVDDKVINRRHEFVSNWRRNPSKQGQPVPGPTEHEQAAIDRATEREHRKTYEFECHVPTCAVGYASNDFHRFAKHMASAHAIQASRDRQGTITFVDADGKVMKVGESKGTGGKAQTLTDAALAAEADAQAAEEAKAAKLDKAEERIAEVQRGAPRRKART